MSREAADICRRAAEVVQARGLAKREIGDVEGGGPVCLWGALKVAGPVYRFSTEGAFLAAVLAERFPHERTSFPGSWWNDEASTTERDVAKLLLQVADDIEFGGAR